MNKKTIREDTSKILSHFNENIESIETLMGFDTVILKTAISILEVLNTRFRDHHGINNPQLTARNALQALKNIRNNKTLKSQYETIFNQALVLLVSYFGSTVHDVFCCCLRPSLIKDDSLDILNNEIKVSIKQLTRHGFDLKEQVAELIISKKGYSFQDMKSINNAFKECFNHETSRGKILNNIILGQACRNSIVHCGSVVDQKLMNQIRDASSRDIKCGLKKGEKINFSPEEIRQIAQNMKTYINDATNAIISKLCVAIPGTQCLIEQ